MRGFDWYSDELRETLRSWPDDVRRDLGRQIRDVQAGSFPARAKWWKDVGSGVIQLKAKGYRNIVTIAIDDMVIAVHAFQKDSKAGIATRKQHKDIVKKRVAELTRRLKPSVKSH